jgi:hypothetical protein
MRERGSERRERRDKYIENKRERERDRGERHK